MDSNAQPQDAASRPREGSVSLWRFLAVAAPATFISLLLLPAIYFGWVSVTIAAQNPIGVVTSHGEGDWLYLASSTNQGVTGVDAANGSDPAAIIHVLKTEMDDLCLSPKIDLPFVADDLRLFIDIGGRVSIGEVTLAAVAATTEDLVLPKTALGVVDGGSGVPGAPAPGAFTVQTDQGAGTVTFDNLDATAYGLVVSDGLQPKTIKVSTGGGGC